MDLAVDMGMNVQATRVWVKDRIREHGQPLRRVCRYLKAWRDFHWSEGGGSGLNVQCRIDYLAGKTPLEYAFAIGSPVALEVVGQSVLMLLIDRSDGHRLKAYGFDSLDVLESALQLIRMHVEALAEFSRCVTWI